MTMNKYVKTALGIGGGLAIGVSAMGSNSASAATSAPAAKIINVDDRLAFQKIDLYTLENNGTLSSKSDKKKKKGDQSGGGKPNMNSGPGMNKDSPTPQFGFEYKGEQYAFEVLPESMTKINESGVFRDKYETSKTIVTIKTLEPVKADGIVTYKTVDKTYEMTLSVKKNGFIAVLVPQEKDARNAIVFYSGVELYKDKSGAYALNVGGDGLTFMDKNGNVSAYQFKPNVKDFHCNAIKAKTSIYDRKLNKKAEVEPDNVLLSSKDGVIKVDGIFKGKKGYTVSDTLGLLAEQKIDSAAMKCVNPDGKYNPDVKYRSVAMNTTKFYVNQVHYDVSTIMKVFGYSLFDGRETIGSVATKDTTIAGEDEIVKGKTDLSVIIGSGMKGMVYNWAQLDSKKGMSYQITAGDIVVKNDGNKTAPAWGHVTLDGKEIVYALAVENGQMVAKLLYADGIGKAKKLQVVNTNIPVGTAIKDFAVTATQEGITVTVTKASSASGKGDVVVLKINNEYGPKKVGEEDNYYKQSFPGNETGMYYDVSKPTIDFTFAAKQQQAFAQRNYEKRANNAFRNYKI